MKRLACLSAALLLVSCSSTPDKPKPSPGGELLCPVAPGATALDGSLEIVSIARDDAHGVFRLVVRAPGAKVAAFARPRWYADASRKREFLAGGDPWVELKVEAGAEARFVVAAPYPFATTLALELAKTRPEAAKEEGKALPGRIVVTPAQEKSLVLWRYPDLELTQYESAAHAGAPKLAVWRNRQGKVVAALEIHVRADAKAAGAGIRFLHTNGRKTIGTSLAYAATTRGAPSEDGWDFVVLTMKDGSEVAVPWRPLVKNASFCGAMEIGGAGLDAAELGGAAEIGSYGADGTAAFEKTSLEPPTWSLATPTGGSLRSGAPVNCEYSGEKPQRWKIRITDDMNFTPASGEGGGTTGSGVLPAGSGSTQLGMLHAARPGKHVFLYESEPLCEDPASSERLTTSDGPTCPGENASTTAEILSQPGKECASTVPGCTTQPVGEFASLVVPVLPSGGTAIHCVTQKGEDPGFIAVAADGEDTHTEVRFDATPIDVADAPHMFIAIGNDVMMCPDPPIAVGNGEEEPGCTCEPCRLVVVLGGSRQGLPPGWDKDDMERELDRIAKEEFDLPPRGGRRDAAKAERHDALIGGRNSLYRENGPNGWDMLDMAIHAAKRFAKSLAESNMNAHYHVLFYDSLDAKGSGAATMLPIVGGRRKEKTGFRNSAQPPASCLATHFSNCHKWHELLFIFHGEKNAFKNVAAQIPRMISTPVRRIVFWSCWGADRIDVNGAEFVALKTALVGMRCNCPGRRPPTPVPPAAHPAGACTACPGPPDHCPYEGTTIITAGTIRANVGGTPTDIAVPLGIDFRRDPANPNAPGRWVLTSPDSVVRVIEISPEGNVTETTQRGGSVFGAPLESDPGLGDRARQRRGAR